MSASINPIQSAIDDARALLETLLSGGWQDIHVASGETEIFIARDGGRPNPMRCGATSATLATNPQPLDRSPDQDHVVTAPHVATVVEVLAVGTHVESGARVATIRVLESEEPVAAPSTGVVTAVHAGIGALVEFKMPILSLGAFA